MTIPDSEALIALVQPCRLTAVVDIGASPLDGGEPPYQDMLRRRLCSLVAFEPQSEALAVLNAGAGELETYLPHAVGDGSRGHLNICRASGMTSLLVPNERVLQCFPGFSHFGEVVGGVAIETRSLDSILEIQQIDLLKIDVQGAELSIFRGGSSKLASAVAIQTEVSFVPLYKNQPVFGDIDLALRSLGFIPHMFASINRRMILPVHVAGNPFAAMNQLLEADVVYVRDFTRAENMSEEQLKQLALIAHYCYGSYDLSARCIEAASARGSLPPGSVTDYLEIVKTTSFMRSPNGSGIPAAA
jgi:FkbM family methyltransferase